MKIQNCVFTLRSVYGSGLTEDRDTVNISDWTTNHEARIVRVGNVAHTVFRLKSSDVALINGGTSVDVVVPETDQLGLSRDVDNPSIGAVEYYLNLENDGEEVTEDNSGGNNNPDNPDNSSNNSTTPEEPDNRSTDNPANNDSITQTSEVGSSGGGCNSFSLIYGLLVLAITLRRK